MFNRFSQTKNSDKLGILLKFIHIYLLLVLNEQINKLTLNCLLTSMFDVFVLDITVSHFYFVFTVYIVH